MGKADSINDEDMNKISGGTSDQNDNDSGQQRVPGIKCPNCGGYAPTSIQQILYSTCIFCPTCGYKINIK